LRYINTLKKVVPKNTDLSYLNAEIINLKVTNILLKQPVNKNNNLDTVSYSESNNIYLTENFFTIYETFIRTNIYELTGIGYTEFKELSILERETMLKYLNFKLDTMNLDVEELTDTTTPTYTDNDEIFR